MPAGNFMGPFEQRKNRTPRFAMTLGLATVLLFSCGNPGEQSVASENTATPNEIVTPMKAQVLEGFSNGLKLEFDALKLLIPANGSRGENLIDLSSSSGQIRLESPSLHGLFVGLDAPVTYNGLDRELALTLAGDDVYFSVSAERDDAANYDLKYHSSIATKDVGGEDAVTKGISYYEYGDLDYVIAEILDILGVDSLSLNLDKGIGLTFDWDAINDSIDAISEYDATRFLWELPLGDKTFPIGLGHDASGVLSTIEFPLQVNQGDYAVLNDDFHLCLKAKIAEDAPLSWAPKYPTGEYVDIVDSLSLFRQIAKLTQRKAFGVTADFNLTHTEDEILGDEDHFATPAVDESAYLRLDAHADLSRDFLSGLNADIVLGQLGKNEKRIGLHSKMDEAEGDARLFLNVNDILKVRTTSDVVSALFSSLLDSLKDESIQNDMIMKLLSSLLATANGIFEAINAVKESAFYENIDKKHFESILSTIIDLQVHDNSISVTVDLSGASLIGTATVLLNGTDDDMSLGKITLDHVGLKSTNDSHTCFTIDGYLTIDPYQDVEFSEEGYVEMTHLPHWTDEINAIAERDQLAAQIDGYALKQGTTSRITSATANQYVYGRTEQGMAFHGSLAFDLQQRLGTGAMTFLDLKEDYVNDHNLKIDLTGEEGENDTDENDMTGNGNENAMYFEYNSRNVTAASGSSTYNSENRSEPSRNPLKGRFSIHSLNGLLDVILQLTEANDPKFERLTNLVSSIMAETLLTKLLKGQYFELLSSKILTSVTLNDDSSTFVIAPGIIQQNTGLTLKAGYAEDGMPKTIEVWMTLEGEENDTEVYAKITLGDTSFDSFPYQFDNHDNANFVDYSSLKTLLGFGIDTISLGNTDEDKTTTYHLGGTVTLEIRLGSEWTVKDVQISLDVYFILHGTSLKILGSIFAPKTTALLGVVKVIPENCYSTFFYETDGIDKEGSLYLTRYVGPSNRINSWRDDVEVSHCKVKGSDFLGNAVDWLAKYMLNLGSIVTDNLDSATSTAGQAFHGEDIVESISVSNPSLSAPSWNLSIGLGALAHTNLLGSLTATISGKKVTHEDESGKQYSYNTLYSITGGTTISILVLNIVATINLSIKNVSTGVYKNAWTDTSATVYSGDFKNEPDEKTKLEWQGWKLVTVKYYEDHYYWMGVPVTGTPEAIWNGNRGKNDGNANYQSAQWYTKPGVVATA